MNAGQVDVLVIVGGNPVYTAPADLQFAEAMDKVPLRVHLSSARRRDVGAVPLADSRGALPRERGATRARYDGTVSIVQPLIAPLYGGKLGARTARGDERHARDSRRTTSSASTGSKQTGDRAAATDEDEPTPAVRDGVAPLAARRRRCRTRRSRRERSPCAARSRCASAAPAAATAGATGSRSRFRTRSVRPRRPLRQQRLAAGAAEADHQADLGQRGPRQPGDRRAAAAPTARRRCRAASTARSSATSSSCAIAAARFAARCSRSPAIPTTASPCISATAARAAASVAHRRRLQRLRDPHRRRAVVRRRRRDRRAPASSISLACTQYHHLMEGRGMVRAVTRDEFVRDPQVGARRRRDAAADDHAVSRLQVRGLQVGHGDRRQRLHRLQRLRRRLPGGEQHPGRRQGSGAARPRDALAPRRHLLPRPGGATRRPTSSRCRACTARTRPARSSARSARPSTATKG